MGFYSDIQIQCVNPDAYYPWYSVKDMDIAERVARHVALTSSQLKSLGYSTDTLSRLVKNGILRRYKVTSPAGSLPSVYTAGNTAGKYARLPVPRFIDMESLRAVLIANQVIVSVLLKTEAKVDVNIKRPIQVVTVNNPTGVMYARSMDYVQIPARYDLSQAIIVIPGAGYAHTGLPFRYVLEDEIYSSDIRYYHCRGDRLLPSDIDFSKKEPAVV